MYKKIGNRFVIANINARLAHGFESKVSNLLSMIASRKNPMTKDESIQIREWREKSEYYRDEQRRYNLQGKVCGKEFVSIR